MKRNCDKATFTRRSHFYDHSFAVLLMGISGQGSFNTTTKCFVNISAPSQLVTASYPRANKAILRRRYIFVDDILAHSAKWRRRMAVMQNYAREYLIPKFLWFLQFFIITTYRCTYIFGTYLSLPMHSAKETYFQNVIRFLCFIK